jgi:hypothetical protein
VKAVWLTTWGEQTYQICESRKALVLAAETSVEEDQPKESISSHLGQNHPNPFNAGTSIPFAVRLSTKAELGVYNLLGQKIRMLIDREITSGEHRATWDGKDDLGRDVSSGVYFYRLTTEDKRHTQTRRMTLLR